MSKVYYSRCCGKYVEKNSDRPDLQKSGVLPEKGYHCSRCHKPLTVYGNYVLEEDKVAEKEKYKQIRKQNGIRGNKVELSGNGDLYLINKWYKKTDIDEVVPHLVEKWVILDWYGNYITAIKIEHKTGSLNIENEPFIERLNKAKFAAVRMTSVVSCMPELKSIDDLKGNKKFKDILINLGWQFRSDGRLK